MSAEGQGHRPVYLVGCAGIPGSGKSSALKRLKRSGLLQEALGAQFTVIFVQEPSKLWRQRGWLQAFYANPSKNAAAFQMLVFDSYIDAVKEAIATAETTTGSLPLIVVVERTFYCQRLFWEQQVETGCESATGMYLDAYERIWSRWRSFVPEPVLIFFFQTTDLQTTMRRVQTRARAEELQLSSSEDGVSPPPPVGTDIVTSVGGLTLDYQQRLLEKHRAWFTEPLARPMGCAAAGGIPCVHVNVDAPYHVDDGALRALSATMAKHILEHVKGEGGQ